MSGIACERLTPHLMTEDIERLADLHLRCLPNQILTMLGREYLGSFYRFVAASPREKAFVARDQGRIVAVCVVTHSEKTILARAVIATLAAFLIAALRAFLASEAFRRACFNVLFGGPRSTLSPQILIMLVDPERIGQGIGSTLVEFIAGQIGGTELYTKTEDDPSNHAVNFYAGNGFSVSERTVYAGRAYLYMRRGLP